MADRDGSDSRLPMTEMTVFIMGKYQTVFGREWARLKKKMVLSVETVEDIAAHV